MMINKLIRKSDIFLICALSLLTLFSCASQKNIPTEQTAKTPSWKNLYYFHAGDSTWIVKPVPSAGNQFSGLIFKPEEIKKNRQAHIYADPLSAVKIASGELSVPMENIVKVENHKIHAATVITIAAVLALLFLIPVYL
jgi:hypothetical protein